MSFFEPLPRRLTAEVVRTVVTSPPPWEGRPHDVLPGIAPVELIIARTEETAVAIAGVHAYPKGFGFTLGLRMRTISLQDEQQFRYLFEGISLEGDDLPDELFRFGLQFADGRKATSLDRPPDDVMQSEPDRPVLQQVGAGGLVSSWDMEYWTWPLPPAGPLVFVCEWPARGIALSRTEVDAELILQAAGRAVTFWPTIRS